MQHVLNQATATTPAVAPAITLDVYAENPVGLRRRLQATAPLVAASLLPGGVILEEHEATLTYRVGSQGPWSVEQLDGEIRLSNGQGHTICVRDGQVTQTLAK